MCICCKPSSRFLKNCLICQDMWAKKLHRIPQDESPVQEWLKLPNVTSYRGSMPAGLLTVLRMRYKIQDARWCVWQVVEVPGCLTEYYNAFDNSRETAGDVLYRLGIYPECSTVTLRLDRCHCWLARQLSSQSVSEAIWWLFTGPNVHFKCFRMPTIPVTGSLTVPAVRC